MAVFEITSPDGKKFEITAPDGASKEQVLAYAQEQFSSMQQQKNIDPETGQPFDRSLPTAMSLSSRPKVQEPSRGLGESLVGAGEAALSTLTGIPASLVGAYAATPEMKVGSKDMSKAEQRFADVTSKLTYQPRTEAGQEYTQALGDLLQSSGIQGLVGMPVPGKTLPKVSAQKPGMTSSILGMTTGTGAEAVSQAYKAGKAGGEKGTIFLENLRQEVPVDVVLSDAKQALQQMKANKSAEYVANKQGWASDTTRLDFGKIDEAYNALENSLKEKGKWKIGSAEKAKVDEVRQVISDWRKSPSLHTTVGLDALKQRIDAIYPDSPKQTQAQRVITGTSNAIKKAIVDQAPDYATAMKDYETMSATIKDIESALSLGSKSSKDSALRKLQSLTRNNVQTNYGGRLDMLKQLEETGGENIMPAVSGQALSSKLPRGLAGQSGATLATLAAYFNPATLATLPLTSPRLIGETAYGAGRLFGRIPTLPKVNAQRTIPYAGLLGIDTNE